MCCLLRKLSAKQGGWPRPNAVGPSTLAELPSGNSTTKRPGTIVLVDDGQQQSGGAAVAECCTDQRCCAAVVAAMLLQLLLPFSNDQICVC